jgi:hypothetical protein
MRIQPLSTANDGMTRLRTKGNAAPSTLYDLLNGYITLAGTIKPRPGTQTDIALPADTKGLVAHKCRLYVFSHTPQVTSNPDKYVVATLRHPTDPTIKIQQIHFQAPFMGFLYVAAEFEDGNTWHYWLEELDEWSPNTDYMVGDRVFPLTENGYAYKATRPGSPNQAWAESVERTVGDVVEPTVYNGFKYTVIDTTGTNPSSGTVEPDWPAESGAQVIEYAHGEASTEVTTPGYDPDPDSGGSEDYQDGRYDNPAGGWQGPYYTTAPYNKP